jgi:hypothetical protein
MSERRRDDRHRPEEPIPQDGPKGFYRTAEAYDPFVPAEGADTEESEGPAPRGTRRRRSRRNWRSMRPRPRQSPDGEAGFSPRWLALALALGFVLGFLTRSIFLPRAALPVPYAEREVPPPRPSPLEAKPDLDDLERRTRLSIQEHSRKVESDALRPSDAPPEVEAIRLSGEEAPVEPPALLRLKPVEIP